MYRRWVTVQFYLALPADSHMSRHLVFFANAEWFFLSHRLPLGLAALEHGYRVSLLAPEAKGRGAEVRSHGIDFIPFNALSRSGTNLVAETRTLRAVRRAIRRLQPDILHNVTLKPVLYGTLAALSLRRKINVVNAVSGLGSAIVGQRANRRLAVMLPRAISFFTRATDGQLIVQNTEDRALFTSLGLLGPARIHLILGSGVTGSARLHVPQLPPGDPVVLFAARLLRDKGTIEFLTAAAQLKAQDLRAKFVVAGDVDPDNLSSVDESTVRTAVDAGIIEWIGFRSDILDVIASSHVVCLPSYREGFPKTLVEAMAVGRAIVTTDVAGCRDAVENGVNGVVCQPRDVDSLRDALSLLLTDHEAISRYGREGRARFERLFTLETVVSQTLAIYRGEVAVRPGAAPTRATVDSTVGPPTVP